MILALTHSLSPFGETGTLTEAIPIDKSSMSTLLPGESSTTRLFLLPLTVILSGRVLVATELKVSFTRRTSSSAANATKPNV